MSKLSSAILFNVRETFSLSSISEMLRMKLQVRHSLRTTVPGDIIGRSVNRLTYGKSTLGNGFFRVAFKIDLS